MLTCVQYPCEMLPSQSSACMGVRQDNSVHYRALLLLYTTACQGAEGQSPCMLDSPLYVCVAMSAVRGVLTPTWTPSFEGGIPGRSQGRSWCDFAYFRLASFVAVVLNLKTQSNLLNSLALLAFSLAVAVYLRRHARRQHSRLGTR